MENVGDRRPAPLGPRAADDPDDALPLSPQRLQILDLLRRTGPHTVSTLAEAAGVHPNTVREHLDGLTELDLATRRRLPSSGRGRPAWQYAARPGRQGPSARDHAALATVLAAYLARTSPTPADDAAAAGQEWGRALVTGRPASASAHQARRDVIDLLAEIGFAPESGAPARTVRLRACPILDVARQHPDVVCAVHAGLVTAALDRLGAPDDAREVTLQPFAVPGACLLHLGTPDGGDRLD